MVRASTLFAALLVGACGDEPEPETGHSLGPPLVAITAPADGVQLRQGDPLSLAGVVGDSFDVPAELSVAWSVDDAVVVAEVGADGTVTAGVDTATLTIGEHAARLEAVDSDGERAHTEVGFAIAGPKGPPTVQIATPEDGATFGIGDTVGLMAEATDLATPAGELTFAWSSDRDGTLTGATESGLGQSALITTTLSEGTHTIRVEVSDGDGEVAEDSVTIAIVDESPPVFYDAFLDFDPFDNDPTHIWQYGYAPSPGGEFTFSSTSREWTEGVFEWCNAGANPCMVINTTGEDIVWDAGGGSLVVLPGAEFLHTHPDYRADSQYSVLRFVVPETGIYTIDCAFKSARLGHPASTDVHVAISGVGVFEASVDGTYDADPSAGEATWTRLRSKSATRSTSPWGPA